MGKFLQSEKPLQAKFKAASTYFSAPARADGLYRGHRNPFCLPRACAEENLFAGIRQPALDYFAAYQIKWHDGHDGKCSNHLCDSMVCGVNFLFPFANQPEALAAVLQPFFPGLDHMLPVEAGQYVAFEWIGAQNYLGEVSHNGLRTRGANYTSADAALFFEWQGGTKQFVLIEWKYTESYYPSPLHYSKSGRDRRTIYRHLFEAPDCPIDKIVLPSYDDLFYEPFYQFMRQQFLAHEMEQAHELDADVVSLLHIAPRANQDFKRITSADLDHLGDSATQIWGRLLAGSGRFLSVATEDMFGNFAALGFTEMVPWWSYILKRYAWINT